MKAVREVGNTVAGMIKWNMTHEDETYKLLKITQLKTQHHVKVDVEELQMFYIH